MRRQSKASSEAFIDNISDTGDAGKGGLWKHGIYAGCTAVVPE